MKEILGGHGYAQENVQNRCAAARNLSDAGERRSRSGGRRYRQHGYRDAHGGGLSRGRGGSVRISGGHPRGGNVCCPGGYPHGGADPRGKDGSRGDHRFAGGFGDGNSRNDGSAFGGTVCDGNCDGNCDGRNDRGSYYGRAIGERDRYRDGNSRNDKGRSCPHAQEISRGTL